MRMSGRVALVLHGDYVDAADLRLWCSDADKIVAADGAADVLFEHGITPDHVVGDMDGIRADTLQELPPESLVLQDDQNTTDFQKSLKFCQENLGAESVAVLNFEGRRVDHMLSAMYSAGQGVRFVGRDAIGVVLEKGDEELAVRKGIRISLLPLPYAKIGSASGLLYDASGLSFEIGGRDGISNEATGDIVSLTIAHGRLIAFVQRFEGETRW